MSVNNFREGDSACEASQAISSESLIPSVALPSGTVWTVIQNNNNNAYYFGMADGSWNNNNKNNTYNVVPVESGKLEDLVLMLKRIAGLISIVHGMRRSTTIITD